MMADLFIDNVFINQTYKSTSPEHKPGAHARKVVLIFNLF